MKKLLSNTFAAIFTLTLITLYVNFAANLIYFLYLWGGVDMAIGAAAWQATKLWLIILGAGLVSLLISALGMAATD